MAALNLNEPFYIASVNVAIGDFVIHHKMFEEALHCYLEALKIISNQIIL
jgi:hypothetical protein